jgi:hypothetical protein
MRESSARVFVEGQDDGLPGLVETLALPRGRPFYLAYQSADSARLKPWLDDECREWRELRIARGLPPRWQIAHISEAVSDRAFREHFPSLAFPDLLRLRLVGGVRVSSGQTYFEFAPPSLRLDGTVGDEGIWVDDRRIYPDSDGSYRLPPDVPVDERIGIEVRLGDQVAKRTAVYLTAEFQWRLAEPLSLFDPCGSRIDQWRGISEGTAVSGSVVLAPSASEARFRFDPLMAPGVGRLDRRVFLIGQNPGDIATWPADPVPATWDPIWAVPMARRGKAIYCGASLESAEPTGIPSPEGNHELWKRVMWRWRHRIEPPPQAPLAALWHRYQEQARYD